MNRPVIVKVAWMGLLTWLIPFVVSVLLYSREGQPLVPVTTFKSIMCILGSGVAVWLLAILFRPGIPTRHAGLIVGVAWLILNLALDLAVLVPMTGMSVTTYFGTIGLTYIAIPVMAMAVEYSSKGNGRRA